LLADTLPPFEPLPRCRLSPHFHQRTPRRCRHFTLCRHYLFRQIAAIIDFHFAFHIDDFHYFISAIIRHCRFIFH
jgi:hypothetical protein